MKRELHGLRGVPEYRVWDGIKQRCLNPKSTKYYMYGARGIIMSRKWQNSFKSFYEDMGSRPSPKHSIERKNNKKGYYPWNCVWATATEQARNTRATKLSLKKARQIRKLKIQGVRPYVLAKMFKTGTDSINLILKNKIWKEAV